MLSINHGLGRIIVDPNAKDVIKYEHPEGVAFPVSAVDATSPDYIPTSVPQTQAQAAQAQPRARLNGFPYLK